MNYRINLGAWRKVFAVPSCVADNLKLASGDQVKVLLYLLANSDMGLRSSDIASALGITESDTDDALLFWENADIICGDGGEYAPAGITSAPQQKIVQTPVKTAPTISPEAKIALTSDPQFPPKEIASLINSDSAVKYLFDTFERLAGRPTKHAEQNTLMILIEEINLPCEVALMLVEYCFSINKASPAYMKSVARDWCESGIDTIGKAEERIKSMNAKHTLENHLRKSFGMNNAFSQKQKEIINGWAAMEISEKLIDEAYDKTLTNTGKLSFQYMDTILKKWHNDGITDVSQLKNEPKHTDAANVNSGSSFNVEDIDKWVLEEYAEAIKAGDEN